MEGKAVPGAEHQEDFLEKVMHKDKYEQIQKGAWEGRG